MDGHARIEAARPLAVVNIPCVRIDHLDCRAPRALRIALTKIQETGDWDEQTLWFERAYQLSFGTDTTVLDFEPSEIDSLLEITPASRDIDDPIDEIGALPGPTSTAVSQLGDIWTLCDQIIGCGRAKDIESTLHLLGDSYVDLVFTDRLFNVRVNRHVRSGTRHF